ncbi:MAG: hypothetical protein K2K39_01950 [Clostridia bacterium]|nr:hypothetical protein [Clostridia bacterium]
MNKIKRLIVFTVAAAACGTVAVTLGGCAKKQDLSGEMSYVQWGTEYGVKVNVQIQSDNKGDRIRKVTVADSDYVSASPAMNGWDPKVWNNGLQTLLNAYRGKYVADVLAAEVVTNGEGAPLVKGDEGFVNYGDDLLITGATLGSGRLLIAVQNALKTLDGYKVAEGEYTYNAWGTDYGERVRVVLKDGKIEKVATLSCPYVNASITASWDAGLWLNAENGILAAYEGKTVEEVLAATSSLSGVDGASENTVSDGSVLVTGATMSSARLLKAVQNALSKV